MFERIRYDVRSVLERDPAARNSFEIFFMYSGLHAIWWYRVGHFFYKKKMFGTARLISQWGRFWTGIEIHPGATIGKRLVIDHGTGVVLAALCELIELSEI